MSTTPRTDAECRKPENAGRVNAVLPAEFARQLETELNAEKEQTRVLSMQLRAYSINPERITNSQLAMAAYAQDDYMHLVKERDELRQLINDLTNGERVILPKTEKHAQAMLRVATSVLSDLGKST